MSGIGEHDAADDQPVTGFDFSGRVVLVTGVGRKGQMGNAVALAFGRAGAQIVACDRDAVGVATRVREFAAEGVDARPCAGDLTHPDVAELAVEIAIRNFGRLDVVVNLAGGLTTYGPIAAITVDGINRELAINLTTAVLVSQAAAGSLAKVSGCIVNVSSIAYFEPQGDMAVYAAAKAAVAGFTRSLAVEFAPRGIRVNAIAPAMARTTDNVSAAGDGDAQYVELGHIAAGIMRLAIGGVGAATGQIVPLTPAPAART